LTKLWGQQPISRARLASAVWEAVRGAPWVLGNGTLGGWARRTWEWPGYRSYLGSSGGAGLGYGLGASIGAALAHREDDVLVVDLQADGDLLYTASALWTAARCRLPLLIVTDNNRTYGKDRLHQSVIAAERGRGADRIDVGIDIDDPTIDLAKLAVAQGVEGFGPVTDPEDLEETLGRAASLARGERRPVLVDVVTSRD
jgi:thiamine pyrophosphate-dependent acetolactate synthase large subunit-like protein